MPPALNTEQSATINGDSSDFGDLSPSCSGFFNQTQRIESVRGEKLSRKLLEIIMPEYFHSKAKASSIIEA